MAGVMGRVALDTSQPADLIPSLVDYLRIQTAVAIGVGISKLIDFDLYFHDNVQSSSLPLA
jgi:hypothetical protein